ncbi:MAG: hypothetical protein A4E25_02071 [Methanobacterium sp. PtaB.Bin024]|jgi:hypothetical protein|nr:MAG: hypothetical protein A4E25_02071 [Methanobacterium sp. PtaB.Bin024]
MKIDFTYFIEGLKKASTNMNDKSYFQIDNTESEELIYRERVYCYELYHQLRCVLGDLLSYKLQGEMDKSKHPIIEENYKPDFIFHIPGTMEENLVVMEVKPVHTQKNKIKDDIEKLINFRNYNYFYGILLMYGNGEQSLPKKIIDLFKSSLSREYDDYLLFIWHPGPGKEIVILNEDLLSVGEEE